MKKKHFVPNKNSYGGTPACKCYDFGTFHNLIAFEDAGEVAKTRRSVTCGNCRRTKKFRGVK